VVPSGAGSNTFSATLTIPANVNTSKSIANGLPNIIKAVARGFVQLPGGNFTGTVNASIAIQSGATLLTLGTAYNLNEKQLGEDAMNLPFSIKAIMVENSVTGYLCDVNDASVTNAILPAEIGREESTIVVGEYRNLTTTPDVVSAAFVSFTSPIVLVVTVALTGGGMPYSSITLYLQELAGEIDIYE
jgi:hypothetical protein